MCEANFCKIQSSKQSLTPKHQFFNVTILQIKGFNKTCFCKHIKFMRLVSSASIEKLLAYIVLCGKQSLH